MLIKRRKHSVPELNTTATADISFMLLTFFLVTTSMDVDRGLVRQLPPLDNDQEQTMDATEVSRDGTLSFKINADGTLLANGKPAHMRTLRADIARFVSEHMERHVIFVDADPSADYNAYFQLENEIVAAYSQVRDSLSRKLYHRPYAMLGETQKKAVRDACPQRISETYNLPSTGHADSQKGGQK